MTPQPVGPHRAGFGESPVWSAEDAAIWWVDLHGRSVLRTREEDGQTEIFKTPGFPANNPRAVFPAVGGGVIVALDDKLARLDPQTGAFSVISLGLPIPDGHIFNDATIDPAGRLIIGTMHPDGGKDGKGVIMAVSRDKPPQILVEGLHIPNGLAFSPNGDRLYVSDSITSVKTVWCADYDPRISVAGARRIFVAATDFPGRPDGAAVDIEGGYWIAALEAGCIHRFAPDGMLTQSLQIPVHLPSKPCFGGSDFRRLYVTTAGPLSGVDDGISGALFATEVPFVGLPLLLCNL